MVWDVETGNLIYSIKAHEGWINSLFFSPPDGAVLISGSMDGTLAFWDASAGHLEQRISHSSSRGINLSVFSPDGSLLAVAYVDKVLRILNASGGGDVLKTLDGHAGAVNSVRFSPDGRSVVSGSDDMTVRLWELDTATLNITMRGHTSKVLGVDFAPDGRTVASGSEDHSIRLWDANSGAQLAIMADHPSGINAIAFSPDGRLIAALTFDDEARVWETGTHNLSGKLDDFPDDSPSGVLPVPVAYITQSSTSETTAYDCLPTSSTITCLIVSTSGRWLASGSAADGRIKVWGADGVLRWTLNDDAHTSGIRALAASPDGTLLASASDDGAVKLWDMRLGVLRCLLGSVGGNASTTGEAAFSFSANGQHPVSGASDGSVMLWGRTPTNESESEWEWKCSGRFQGHTEAVRGLAFSPRTTHLVSWSDTTAVLWELLPGARPAQLVQSAVLREHARPITHVAFSSNGGMLVSCSEDATIRLWNRAGTPMQVIESTSLPIGCIAFSPDDRYLAYFLADNTISIWDLDSEVWVRSCTTDVPVKRMAFSSCGRYLDTDHGRLDVGPNPTSQSPSGSTTLFVTRNWIRRNGLNMLWLPDDYRFCQVAVLDRMVALGHQSGAISFIEVS